jgi:predicted RNase H-like nuclease (RuvC/YqgF family)
MGPAALASVGDRTKNRSIAVYEMTSLLDEIHSLIDAPEVDRGHLERTLTDGYAHALSLETERSRLEKRLGEVIQQGDSAEKAQELTALSKRLDGSARELTTLRNTLARLRRRVR